MSFRILPWKYINEGNVHIVLQVLNSNYVLRIIKKDSCGVQKTTVFESVLFVNIVMIPLIFFDTRYQEEVVEISPKDLVELAGKLSKFRPKTRMFKSNLSTTAIKAPNLTIVTCAAENYCIEIKPKEGYLASSLKKTLKCYYCLKQFMKLNENQIHNISNYCPLDLFSGDRQRMKFALESLIENPQNNFKIFKNGVLIYDENKQKDNFENILKQLDAFYNTNVLLDFIIEILLSDGKSDIDVIESDKTNVKRKHQHCKNSDTLTKESFLKNLLFLQRLSEGFNYEKGVCENDVNYVGSILEDIEKQKLNLTNPKHREFFLTWDPFYLTLISATVKDCSIMISFTKSVNNQHPKVFVGGTQLSYQLGVTDLEPKMSKVLQKRRETERKLLNIYSVFNNELILDSTPRRDKSQTTGSMATADNGVS